MNKPKPIVAPGRPTPDGRPKGTWRATLKKVAQPDHTETHRCDACHRPPDGRTVVETRQVFDIPPLRYEVTEHQVAEIRCRCGKICRDEFPEGLSAPVQYGPRIKAAVVHLTHHHMMPVARTGALMGDFFGLPMSDATVLAASEEAKTRLAATVVDIGNALQAAPVAHADETGMRVAGKLISWPAPR
ncbi:MAG: IS66 family transposase [Sulfuricella sp.]